MNVVISVLKKFLSQLMGDVAILDLCKLSSGMFSQAYAFAVSQQDEQVAQQREQKGRREEKQMIAGDRR